MRTLVCCLFLMLSCSRPVEPSRTPSEGLPPAAPATADAAAPPSAPATGPVIERAVHVQEWLGKPPLAIQYVDVTLHNPADGPRWILLPETFPYAGDTKPAPGDGPLAELQIFEVSKSPRVILAKAVGSHFWTVRMAAGARIDISRLPIDSWWEKTPSEVELAAIVATEVLVDGKPLSACYEADPLSVSARVAAPKDAGDPRALKSWHPAGDRARSAPVVVREERRHTVRLVLDK